jgi:hypothetical protein
MNKIAIENAKDRDMASSFAAQTGTSLIVRHGEQIDRVTVTDQDA